VYFREATIDVAVLGDMGLDYESDNTVAQLTLAAQSGAFDFVLHAGDIACAYPIRPICNQAN